MYGFRCQNDVNSKKRGFLVSANDPVDVRLDKKPAKDLLLSAHDTDYN